MTTVQAAFISPLGTAGQPPRLPKTSHRKPPRRHHPSCTVILGGSSGVGLEAATYLRSRGEAATSFSRRTGHDLLNPTVSSGILPLASNGLAICVGSGRRPSSRDEELALYRSIISCLSAAPDIALVVAVARTLVLTDVSAMMRDISSPWVILRPGPLVDLDVSNPKNRGIERLLVTPDLRCNGLVSRRGVGIVVGDLLLGKFPISKISEQVLGVYDEGRMISLPENIERVHAGQWGREGP